MFIKHFCYFYAIHFYFCWMISLCPCLQLNNFRPEFRSGLDALTKFVFDRTRPKQLGASTLTGPVLAGLTQSFLDAINTGAVPTISSSWQVSLLKIETEICLNLIFSIYRVNELQIHDLALSLLNLFPYVNLTV